MINVDVRTSVQTPYGNRAVTNVMGEAYQVSGWQQNAMRLRDLVPGMQYTFIDVVNRNTTRNGLQQFTFNNRSQVIAFFSIFLKILVLIFSHISLLLLKKFILKVVQIGTSNIGIISQHAPVLGHFMNQMVLLFFYFFSIFF